MYADPFREIGLTEGERIVYLALLELGDTTRSAIVKKSGIAGSKIYDVLERLRLKGLASIYMQNNVKHFRPQNPKQLLNFLDSKKLALEEQKSAIQEVLPKLMAQFLDSKEEQEVELLVGYPSVRLYFQEQVEELKKGEINYVIGGTRGVDEDYVIAMFRAVHKQRERKGIKTRMLYNSRQRKTVKEHYSAGEFRFTETRFIDHASAVSMNIHHDKVLILVFGKELTGIKITSADIRNSFMEYFDLLWNTAKP